MSTSKPSAFTSNSGFLPFMPNLGKCISGILISKFADGLSISMSTFGLSISRDGPLTSRSALGNEPSMFPSGNLPFSSNLGKSTSISAFGPSTFTSRSGVFNLASGNSTSRSAFGVFPLNPNLGKLKSGICKSKFPFGFSTLISRDGPSAFKSMSGVSIFASGKSTSRSAFGFFPLNPNLGKLNSGICKSMFPFGFPTSISRDGPSALISRSGVFTFASGNSTSRSAFGCLPLNPNLGKLISGI